MNQEDKHFLIIIQKPLIVSITTQYQTQIAPQKQVNVANYRYRNLYLPDVYK